MSSLRTENPLQLWQCFYFWDTYYIRLWLWLSFFVFSYSSSMRFIHFVVRFRILLYAVLMRFYATEKSLLSMNNCTRCSCICRANSVMQKLNNNIYYEGTIEMNSNNMLLLQDGAPSLTARNTLNRGQLSLAIPPWVGAMSTGQRAVMLCDWE